MKDESRRRAALRFPTRVPEFGMFRMLSFVAAVVAVAFLARYGCRPVEAEDAPDAPPVSVVSGTFAIVGVTVVDTADGRLVPNQTVVANGDRIAAVGPADTTRAADGVPTLDGRGKFLIPGLWDMHAHVVDPAMPPAFLRYGVTGVRHMFSLLPDVPVRASDPARGGSGPRVVAATHLLDGPKTGFPWLLRGNVVTANTPADARAAVRRIRDLGNDFLKIGNALPADAYLAAVAEAKALGLPVAGHVPFTMNVFDCVAAGHRVIEHLDGVAAATAARSERWLAERKACLYARDTNAAQSRVDLLSTEDERDPAKTAALMTAFTANGVWHVPTLAQMEATGLLGDPAALPPAVEADLPASARLFWDRHFPRPGEVTLTLMGKTLTAADLKNRQAQFRGEHGLAGMLHRAGVKLLAGTDTPYPLVVPGFALHRELELLVGAGMTAPEALRAATLDPARCLGREADLGSVAVGKYADLVLLSADPTAEIANIRRIETVLVGGRVVWPVAPR